ncbi:hypothetical protein QYF36_019361 [Acer negundo]|nr:hypothetical protein QYF36_019361 [Acer negundo]
MKKPTPLRNHPQQYSGSGALLWHYQWSRSEAIINVFERLEMFYTVKSCFSQGELHLITGSTSFGSLEVVVVRKENLGKDFKILDEVFKLVEQNVDLKAKMVTIYGTTQRDH